MRHVPKSILTPVSTSPSATTEGVELMLKKIDGTRSTFASTASSVLRGVHRSGVSLESASASGATGESGGGGGGSGGTGLGGGGDEGLGGDRGGGGGGEVGGPTLLISVK